MRWSSLIPTRFLVSRGTWDSSHSPSAFHLRGFHALRLTFPGDSVRQTISSVAVTCSSHSRSLYPKHATPAGFNTYLVWALSRSLAATKEIDTSFFSSGYLDVSVLRVCLTITMDSL